MKIRSLRQVTDDSNHNAFTGARFFKGSLYVSYRQGDAHVCNEGKIVVLRSRNEGVSFDNAAVIRGRFDTRDAHLYQKEDKRLFVCGFEANTTQPGVYHAGCAYTDNGLEWSPWMRYSGTGNYIMWRPEYFKGTHYCSGYREIIPGKSSEIAWFTSKDGLKWKKQRVLHAGTDQPNECNMDFAADGAVTMIVRREHRSHKPMIMRSLPPYKTWDKLEIDVPLAGPALWLTGNDIWFSGRWFITPSAAHVAIFKLEGDKPEMKIVLPSGPGFDLSYMGVAKHPHNRRRVALSYYSGHNALKDPSLDQWSHPQIYLADVIFDVPYISQWKVSEVLKLPGSLASAVPPDPSKSKIKWHQITSDQSQECGFADASHIIFGKKGIAYFVTDIEVGPVEDGFLHFGYDAPVRIWLNGKDIHTGHGKNPAIADQISLSVKFRHGRNRIAIAMDTSSGTACGVFGRFEAKG
ncbi:MAG: exo-alpha-sialidase [Phycisphaeraceae bacterium]|nr:exo-alpha-sialidase [Phycisphaeraceae bacterium]